MPIQVDWDNADQTIIKQNFTDPWTIDEHRQSMMQISEMVATQTHTVHIIADMRQSQRIPGKLLLNMRLAESLVQPNMGHIVIVDAPPFARSILRASQQLIPQLVTKLHTVNSLHAAYRVLEQHADPETEPARR